MTSLKIATVFLLLVVCKIAGGQSPCPRESLPCDDDECIERQEWCDGSGDCEDESDERYCEKRGLFSGADPNECSDSHFLCKSGMCVPLVARCDDFNDCNDESDEKDCSTGTPAPVTTTSTESEPFRPVAGPAVSSKAVAPPVFTDSNEVDEFLGYDKHSKVVEKGVKWLLSTRSANYGWGESTARAMIALGLTNPQKFSMPTEDDNLMKKQLQVIIAVQLLRNRTEPVTLSRLAMYVNAMLATCEDPHNFHGLNLVRVLRQRTSAAYNTHGQRQQTFVNPIALLTLCSVGETIQSDVHKLLDTVRARADEQRWHDMQAISVMAFSCILKRHSFANSYIREYHSAVANILSRLSSTDGSFGNIYSTALAVQALLSSDAVPLDRWRPEQSLNYLARHQLESGSFGDLLSTYYILPALARKSLASLPDMPCPPPLDPETGLTPLDVLLNWQGPRQYVRYSLYYGKPVDVSYSILLHVPLNTSFFDIMRLAQYADPKFKFHYELEDDGLISVYSIGQVPNDAEKGIYWQLFADLNSEYRRRNEKSNDTVTLKPYSLGVRVLLPKDNDHVAFWYRPIDCPISP